MTTTQQDETWHYQISRFELYKGIPDVRDAYSMWVKSTSESFLWDLNVGVERRILKNLNDSIGKKVETPGWMKPKHVGSNGQSVLEEAGERWWGTP